MSPSRSRSGSRSARSPADLFPPSAQASVHPLPARFDERLDLVPEAVQGNLDGTRVTRALNHGLHDAERRHRAEVEAHLGHAERRRTQVLRDGPQDLRLELGPGIRHGV